MFSVAMDMEHWPKMGQISKYIATGKDCAMQLNGHLQEFWNKHNRKISEDNWPYFIISSNI